jgi:hypothetical protein
MPSEASTVAEIVLVFDRQGWRPGCSVLIVTACTSTDDLAAEVAPKVVRTATDPAAARYERRVVDRWLP